MSQSVDLKVYETCHEHFESVGFNYVAVPGLDGYAARKLNQCSEFGAWVSQQGKYLWHGN